MVPTFDESLAAIRAARPPTTDPLTYCTILEYHLRKELLPELHSILQDATLTADIGWDLVNVLTPLLPQSSECLEDVARLGNPRECIIKALEGLRLIEFSSPKDVKDSNRVVDGQDAEADLGENPHALEKSDVPASALSSTETGTTQKDDSRAAISTKPPPVLIFKALISLLSTLHARIKTAHPSRFLSSSLQAILASYAEAAQVLSRHDLDEITSAVCVFVKSISSKRQPPLPPRDGADGSGIMSDGTGPDPEAAREAPSSTELELQIRLLQSFITHVVEDYVTTLSTDGYAGLAWSARLDEIFHRNRVLTEKVNTTRKLTDNEVFKAAEAKIGHLANLAKELDLSSEELLKTVTGTGTDLEQHPENDDLPSSASEVPLSEPGSVILLAHNVTAGPLSSQSQSSNSIPIFPTHFEMAKTILGIEEIGGLSGIGNESPAIIDAFLSIGQVALGEGKLGLDDVDLEQFHGYLQRVSLLSAQTPDPGLRFSAHTLCSAVLHAHPSDVVRLAYIRDTLEHCPDANLQASAVEWTKEEILLATTQSASEDVTFFNSPVALDSLAPLLFPAQSHLDARDDEAIRVEAKRLTAATPFYLASTNFLLMLCLSAKLREQLDVEALAQRYEIKEKFVQRLASNTSFLETQFNDEVEFSILKFALHSVLDRGLPSPDPK